jgi:hypothetical protein
LREVGRKDHDILADALPTLIAAASDPALDPNFTPTGYPSILTASLDGWENRVLRGRCRNGTDPTSGSWDPTAPRQSPGLSRPWEKPALVLLARGANPWTVPIEDRKHSPFIHARWALAVDCVEAMLRHPDRPSWDALLNQMTHPNETNLRDWAQRAPGFIPAFLAAGLDVNWQDSQGNSLLFYASLSVAQWLVTQGAHPHLTNHAGQTPVGYQQAQGWVTNSADLEAWLNLGGQRGALDPISVFQTALSGNTTRLKTLFKGQGRLQDWRWQPQPNGPVFNLLDAVANAALPGGDLSDGLFLDLLNRKSAKWPESSLRTAALTVKARMAEYPSAPFATALSNLPATEADLTQALNERAAWRAALPSVVTWRDGHGSLLSLFPTDDWGRQVIQAHLDGMTSERQWLPITAQDYTSVWKRWDLEQAFLTPTPSGPIGERWSALPLGLRGLLAGWSVSAAPFFIDAAATALGKKQHEARRAHAWMHVLAAVESGESMESPPWRALRQALAKPDRWPELELAIQATQAKLGMLERAPPVAKSSSRPGLRRS